MLRIATWSLFAAGLVACGGGGSDDNAAPPSSGLLDVTAANSDTLSHATAAALFAFGSAADAIPAGAGQGAAAQAASTVPRGGAIAAAAWLPPRLVDVLLQFGGTSRETSAGQQAQPLAMMHSPPEACAIAGTSTTSVDDHDNNGDLSPGDVVTVAFDNCRDDESEVLNGSATVSITRVGATALPSFGASMSMSQVSQRGVDGRHGLTVNGNFNLDYEHTTSTTEHARFTANGPVTIAAHTHQSFNDTVTLESGFERVADHDLSTGITRTHASGRLHSPAAGSGAVNVSTPQAIEVADTDRYPRSGSVMIAGQGSVVLNALPNQAVQINLDADGDDSYESSRMESWDWLF
jgi:hypothetical protein